MKRSAALAVLLLVATISIQWRKIAGTARRQIRGTVALASEKPPARLPSDEDWTIPRGDLASADRRLSAPSTVSDRTGGVTVRLHRVHAGATVVSFGVPLRRGEAVDAARVRLSIGGAQLACNATPLVWFYDASGRPQGLRAVRVQFPAAAMTGDTVDVEVTWTGEPAARLEATAPARFGGREVSVASPVLAWTMLRTVERDGRGYHLVEQPEEMRTVFVGREPSVIAVFPAGYLAGSGLLGRLATADEANQPETAGLSFLSRAAFAYGLDAMYASPYALHPASVEDPGTAYESWLYDRCASFLILHAHTGDDRFLRHALRSCSYFARQIELEGENAGTFRGKPDPDPKYSHLRGLFAYYALTGDEVARAAGEAIARMWLEDRRVVAPYAAGRLRAPDKLWTERLLGTALEGLLYGHWLTGQPEHLDALRRLVNTTYRHVTGDATTLAGINPGVGPYPPQDCLVHSAEQHGEGEHEPWCSGWMSELLIDPLLGYQEQTGDDRVDEIMVRLARFLRDVGTEYFVRDPLGDSFAKPSACFDERDPENPRILVPAYGAGVDGNGRRVLQGEWSDFEHCADATALTAAALSAVARRTHRAPALPAPTVGAQPGSRIADDGQSLLLLHHELAYCARWVFDDRTRTNRDPSTWTPQRLSAEDMSDPSTFVMRNKIGYPVHALSVGREISWWFNSSLLQFRLLRDAGITVPELRPGLLQPAGCAPPSLRRTR